MAVSSPWHCCSAQHTRRASARRASLAHAEALPEALPEAFPEVLPEALTEALPEALPEAFSECGAVRGSAGALPEALPEAQRGMGNLVGKLTEASDFEDSHWALAELQRPSAALSGLARGAPLRPRPPQDPPARSLRGAEQWPREGDGHGS